jgi:hypothetical protein
MQTNVKDKHQDLTVTYRHRVLGGLPLLRAILSLSRFVNTNISLLWDACFSQLDISDIPDITLTF